jgi:membrane-bound lytic murein transglycosylase A
MNLKIFITVTLAVLIFMTGCQKPTGKQYDRQLPPGALALRKITNPADIPDFTQGSYTAPGIQKAIDNSLNYLSKPSSKQFFPYGEITHQHAVESLQVFKKMINSGLMGSALNEAIREQFDVYISVGCDDMGTVLFTGYYTPIFDGSFKQTDRFRYPLYSLPDDLVKNSFGQTLGRRMPDGQIAAYPARAEIEQSNMLKSLELVWLSDPFEVYVAQVQGSCKIRLPDGQLTTIGYAGNNGHEYQSISKELVNDGKISADQLSLSSMIEFFKQNPDLVASYTQRNPRFVFFRKDEGPPRGSLNEPVTTLKSIATDKTIYPRACLAYFSTVVPRLVGGSIYHDPYNGFALDQDTGGAIRAPGRCDIYLGQGDEAGKLAGQTYTEGRLYYLFLKPEMLTATPSQQQPQQPQATKADTDKPLPPKSG